MNTETMGKIAKFGLISVGVTALVFVLTFTVLRNTSLVSRILLHDSEIGKLNNQLTDLSVMYVTAPEAAKPQLNDLKKVAEHRRDSMARLAHDNPKRFLANRMTDQELKKIPKEIKDAGLVEETKSVQGKLVATQLENFSTHEVRTEYSVAEGEKGETTYSLAPTVALQVPSNQIGGQVTASGVAIGAILVVDTQTTTNLTTTSIDVNTQALPGSQRDVLIISFNFLNDKANPATNAELEGMVFNDPDSSKRFYLDSSYGKVDLVGRAVGPFTIPFQKVEGNCYDYNQWAIAADALAYASGVDINAYNHKIYSFPRPDNCWAGAWADIGGNPARVYLPGRMYAGIVTHEIGHNLGFNHANFRSCSSPVTVNQMQYTNDTCSNVEYGDIYDTMGASGTYFHSINAPHRVQAGWLDPSQITTVTSSGTYTITPLNVNNGGVKTIRIAESSVDENYYLEYRLATGFDSNLDGAQINGIFVHSWGGNSTYLLDANLGVSGATPKHANSDVINAVLQDGQTFQDTSDGITVKLISHNNENAVIEVTIDQTLCQRAKPGISIDPVSQTAAIDENKSYRITVTNNDSATCAPGYVSAYANGDSLVSAADGYHTEDAMAPGSSFTFTYTGHADWRTTLGDHKINVSANTASHYNQATANFTLTGHLQSVQINPTGLTTHMGDAPTHLSALAYDNYGRPVWTNLTYEWGMSSTATVGTLHADLNIADFIPLHEGYGDMFVIVRQGDVSVTGGMGITVLPAVPGVSPSPSASVPASPAPSPSPSASPLMSVPPSASASAVPSILPSPSSSVRPSGDINHDGAVNQSDIDEILLHFGSPYTIFDYNAVVINFNH